MSKKITVYSTPMCGYCHMLKDYLKEKNIEYTDYNVMTDKVHAQEMVDKTGQMGVPVILAIDKDGKEEFIIGFDKNKVNAILGIQE